MTEQDRPDFAALMISINEVSANKRKLTAQFIDFYFEALRKLNIEQIRKNAEIFFQENTGFFPSIKELLGPEIDKETEAAFLWVRVNDWIKRYNSPEIGKQSSKLKTQMEKENEGYIFPLVVEWYKKIIEAPAGVVYKEFVNSHKGLTEVEKFVDKTGRLPFKQIGGAVFDATKNLPVDFQKQLESVLPDKKVKQLKGEFKND